MDNEKDYISPQMAEVNKALETEEVNKEEFVCVQDADVIGNETEYLEIVKDFTLPNDILDSQGKA